PPLASASALPAFLWLALPWPAPWSALSLSLGPALAPLGAIGFLPIAGQVVRNPVRRAAQVAAAVLAAAAVAGIGRLSSLGVEAAEQPLQCASPVRGALLPDRAVVPAAGGPPAGGRP